MFQRWVVFWSRSAFLSFGIVWKLYFIEIFHMEKLLGFITLDSNPIRTFAVFQRRFPSATNGSNWKKLKKIIFKKIIKVSFLLQRLVFRRNRICFLCLKCSLEKAQISIQVPFYIRIYLLQDKHEFVQFYLKKTYKINILSEYEVFLPTNVFDKAFD